MATSLATPSPDLTPVPAIAHPPAIPKIPKIPKTTSISSTAPSSNTSSDMDDVDLDIATTARARPLFSSTRKSSGTNIIPQDQPDVEVRPESFPPGDARAMSPRRTSVEMEKLGRETRVALQRHARTLQSGLNALAEKIETVKSDHDKLERQNIALQDYIGGLTRSMSRTDLTGKGKK